MDARQMYEKWLRDFAQDPDLVRELTAIAGDDKEIEDRFYRGLEFGTAGMRGVIGYGTNRMNAYNVRRATQGLANFIEKVEGGPQRGVAIAYDSRRFSRSLPWRRPRSCAPTESRSTSMRACGPCPCSPSRSGICTASPASSSPPATTQMLQRLQGY